MPCNKIVLQRHMIFLSILVLAAACRVSRQTGSFSGSEPNQGMIDETYNSNSGNSNAEPETIQKDSTRNESQKTYAQAIKTVAEDFVNQNPDLEKDQVYLGIATLTRMHPDDIIDISTNDDFRNSGESGSLQLTDSTDSEDKKRNATKGILLILLATELYLLTGIPKDPVSSIKYYQDTKFYKKFATDVEFAKIHMNDPRIIKLNKAENLDYQNMVKKFNTSGNEAFQRIQVDQGKLKTDVLKATLSAVPVVAAGVATLVLLYQGYGLTSGDEEKKEVVNKIGRLVQLISDSAP